MIRPAPKVYGWCPGALRPMASGDGLVVRIRAPHGRLTSEQALRVAELSQTYGNGLLDLSARANLQMRGISEERHPDLIAGLRDIGLVDETAETEARRNIIVTPFWKGDAPTQRIARDLAEQLRQAKDLRLPGKFGFAVDTERAPVLHSTAADIRVECGSDCLLLFADGSDLGKRVTPDTAAQESLRLARWFLEQGGAPDGRGRMSRLVTRRDLPSEFSAPRSAPAPSTPPGQTPVGQMVALEFGQTTADTLRALASLGPIRLTPWRMLLVETEQAVPPLPGLILDETDPRLQVIACTGAPECLQAHAPTRDLARQLAPYVPHGRTLHISGCTKGCAHPKPADLTLVARTSDSFDLIRCGTASDHPEATDLIRARLPEILKTAR